MARATIRASLQSNQVPPINRSNTGRSAIHVVVVCLWSADAIPQVSKAMIMNQEYESLLRPGHPLRATCRKYKARGKRISVGHKKKRDHFIFGGQKGGGGLGNFFLRGLFSVFCN